ncbi:uncharacterized protein LOC131850813 [Achroia grisella]|uniref:uncharacterized protein LOC131850813 n=1 Tax=Achroia grisella TaxID=688607 RepID=UPI0027D20C1A|nr:uncharacterized protein LOC131850813 [Achroia grisella]
MSEEHDVDCAISEKQHENEHKTENSEVVNEYVPEEPKEVRTEDFVNAIDTNTESATNNKNISEKDGKISECSANDKIKSNLRWTLDGNEFKISWSLPEELSTTQDYIALCYAGKCCSLYSSRSVKVVPVTSLIRVLASKL